VFSARTCVLHETRAGTAGLHVDEITKEAQVEALNLMLSLNLIGIHEHWVSASAKDDKLKRQELFQQYVGQSKRYSRIQEMKRQTNGTYKLSKPVFTGKLGGDNDDSWTSVLLAIRTLKTFHSPENDRKYGMWPRR